MYKVINIGAGETDRFITILNEEGIELRVFDYSASSTENILDTFQLIAGKEYDMKLELFGQVVENCDFRSQGTKIQFEISGKECVGKHELYIVQTEWGKFFIPIDKETMNIERKLGKKGYYNFSRIDLVQVDDKVHPDYKKQIAIHTELKKQK